MNSSPVLRVSQADPNHYLNYSQPQSLHSNPKRPFLRIKIEHVDL